MADPLARTLAMLLPTALLAAQAAGVTAAEAPPASFADGRDAAPGGPAPHPALLAGYAARPPWAVAGVDYAVGAPRGLLLHDPASIVQPGLHVDVERRTVFIDGDGVVLDGYDFGLAEGWGIYIGPAAKGTLIQNSRFHVGRTNLVPIHAAKGSGDLTVRRCTLNGGNRTDGTVWALVAYSGAGVFVAEYNLFADAPADAIDFDSGPMRTIVRYNLFENFGSAQGSHPDSVQYVGVHVDNSVIDFNTIYQPHPSGMQGIQLDAQLSSAITNTVIRNNTVLARGPSIDMSYLIAVGETADSEVNGVVVADNYLDVRGAYGPFYPPTGRGLSFVGNVDIATGRAVPAPPGTSATDVLAVSVTPSRTTLATGAALLVTLTLDRPASVTGTPALLLNTHGRATYASGSGSAVLTFSYTIAANDRPVSTLAVMAAELPDGAAIVDANGNRLDLSGATAHFAGLAVAAHVHAAREHRSE